MSRKTLLVALLVAVVVASGSPTVAEARGRARPSLEAPRTGAGAQPPLTEPVEMPTARAAAGPPPVELLRAWDARRAEAWARGDPRALRPLYAPGSVAGRHDRAMLRAWRSRGVVVKGLQTQLIAVRTLRHTSSTWTLRVIDRLVGGVAVGAGTWKQLPVDHATTHLVELRRSGGRWRVAAVGAGSGGRRAEG